jgi:hypothetical protein
MLIGFLTKPGLEIYRLKESEIRRLSWVVPKTGMLGKAGILEKRVLVIGREYLFHTKKKYPPMSRENIKKAVDMEIGSIIPIQGLAHCFRIAEQSASYTLIDIWGWDPALYAEVEDRFAFHYVVPEDIAYFSIEPEIAAMKRGDYFQLLAYGSDGFTNGLTIRTLALKELEMFLRGMGKNAELTKTINVYGGAAGALGESVMGIPVYYHEEIETPLFLADVARLPLKEFKVDRKMEVATYAPLVLRGIIYFLLAYALSLFIAEKRYDTSIAEVAKKLSAARKQLSQVSVKEKEGGTDLIKELEEKRKLRINPLPVINALARSLPESSYVTKMNFLGPNLDLTLSARDPLQVMEVLTVSTDCVQSATLKGAFAKPKDFANNLPVTLELKPCD